MIAMESPPQKCMCKNCKCEKCECKVLRRILMPIDSTGEDVEVLNWVMDNVHRPGDEIVLLHVIPARFPQYSWGMYDDSFVEVPDPEEEKKWREDCAKYVAETLLPILDQRGKNVSYKLDIIAYEMNNTSIGEIVCEKASIIDADLVVMASHRKGRVQEFFVGSVTNYCLHHSKVPLIVYKSSKETKKEKEASLQKKEAAKTSSQHKEGESSSIDFEKVTLQEG